MSNNHRDRSIHVYTAISMLTIYPLVLGSREKPAEVSFTVKDQALERSNLVLPFVDLCTKLGIFVKPTLVLRKSVNRASSYVLTYVFQGTNANDPTEARP